MVNASINVTPYIFPYDLIQFNLTRLRCRFAREAIDGRRRIELTSDDAVHQAEQGKILPGKNAIFFDHLKRMHALAPDRIAITTRQLATQRMMM